MTTPLRLLLAALAILVLAGCSQPTGPRLPPSDEPKKDPTEPPDKVGLLAPTAVAEARWA